MSRRSPSVLFSVGAIIVCILAIVLVITSSISLDEGFSLDLSRGRGIMLAASLAIIVLATLLISQSRRVVPSESHIPETEAGTDNIESQPAVEALDTITTEEPDLVSNLPEDERRLFDMLDEAGGEMLQMNIVSSGVFSKAKVTRLLDKLENRGLVVRERHGMTNRVRIIR